MYVEMAGRTTKSKFKLQIDENLKRIYNETLKDDIPEHLKLLLDQLKQKTEEKLSDESGGRDG